MALRRDLSQLVRGAYLTWPNRPPAALRGAERPGQDREDLLEWADSGIGRQQMMNVHRRFSWGAFGFGLPALGEPSIKWLLHIDHCSSKLAGSITKLAVKAFIGRSKISG